MSQKIVSIITKIFVVILCAMLQLSLFGCQYRGYKGKYNDLYTTAINSILWNNGYSYGADRVIDSSIEVLEIDSFGRTLFTYHEKYYNNSNISFLALIITQYSDSKNVYYYEGDNYIIKKQEIYNSEIKTFDENEIIALKQENDWNEELLIDNCTKKQIINSKLKPSIDEEVLKEQLKKYYNIREDCNIIVDLLTTDIKKNSILYGSIYKYNEQEYIYFIVFVNGNNECIDFLLPNDVYNYKHELTEFADKNGWVSN